MSFSFSLIDSLIDNTNDCINAVNYFDKNEKLFATIEKFCKEFG